MVDARLEPFDVDAFMARRNKLDMHIRGMSISAYRWTFSLMILMVLGLGIFNVRPSLYTLLVFLLMALYVPKGIVLMPRYRKSNKLEQTESRAIGAMMGEFFGAVEVSFAPVPKMADRCIKITLEKDVFWLYFGKGTEESGVAQGVWGDGTIVKFRTPDDLEHWLRASNSP